MIETTWQVVAVLAWVVQLAVMVGAVLWARRARAADAAAMTELRRDVRQGLGVAAQAFGHATATFGKQAISLLAEVRAVAGQPPSPAVPAPPPSEALASFGAVDSVESDDDHRTVEMDVYARDSDVDERTVVRDATATPIGAATRAKLARLRGDSAGEPAKGVQ